MKSKYIINSIFLFVLTINVIAQKQDNMHEITVLSEYKSKSTVVYKTETKYYEKAEGNITVSFDKENKVIQMLAPKSVPIDLFARVSSIDDFKKCIEPCDQEFWCVVECALDHLF